MVSLMSIGKKDTIFVMYLSVPISPGYSLLTIFIECNSDSVNEDLTIVFDENIALSVLALGLTISKKANKDTTKSKPDAIIFGLRTAHALTSSPIAAASGTLKSICAKYHQRCSITPNPNINEKNPIARGVSPINAKTKHLVFF